MRDFIPEHIAAGGETPVTRVLNTEEFRTELKRTLIEEAQECSDAATVEDIVIELADIEEVILALLRTYEITPQAVETARQQKHKERGGFAHQIYLEDVN